MTGRFSEGYTFVDFKKVIDTKAEKWLNDPHW
ncbi:conserved phage C-terminal domain-containing protein [Sporosarcina sp. NPDC096371]